MVFAPTGWLLNIARWRHILKCFSIFLELLIIETKREIRGKSEIFTFTPSERKYLSHSKSNFCNQTFHFCFEWLSLYFPFSNLAKVSNVTSEVTNPWRRKENHTEWTHLLRNILAFRKKKVWSIKTEFRWEGTPFNDGDIVKRQLFSHSLWVFPKRKLPSRTTAISSSLTQLEVNMDRKFPKYGKSQKEAPARFFFFCKTFRFYHYGCQSWKACRLVVHRLYSNLQPTKHLKMRPDR